MSPKITSDHLCRKAYVYIRQSSMDQVRNNLESQRRQYELADKARSMGWHQVDVIDEDLGRSGASAVERTGFQHLVAEVGLGRCGAIFSLEASRLARNNADWYRLLDLCSLAKTLIVDSEAVYDPRLSNDRLLLGLKGALSEAELGLIFQRAHQGLMSKAKRGELYTSVPIGYVQSHNARLEKDPDLRVQESIQGVFAKFSEAGSARQTLLWYRQERIRLPARQYGRWGWETTWKIPVYNTILKFIKNPIYAGAYVWGRTGTETVIENGRARKYSGRHKSREDWTVWIRDHHEGYTDWTTFERNQQTLSENLHMEGTMAKGAIRSGRSLLAGLLSCGQCGRRLHVSYGGVGSVVPRYSCQGALLNHGGQKCISFGGFKVDRVVGAEIVRLIQPASIEAALKVAEKTHQETQLKKKLLERELEQLRYEADRAYRQYDAVDPTNRLVAESLEKKWNSALQYVQQAESRIQEVSESIEKIKKPNREELLQLADSFPKIWADAETDIKIKKRIARLLIEEIIASVDDLRREVHLVIRWKGGEHSRLTVKKNKTGHHSFCTDKQIVDLVRELAVQLPDRDIARVLNRLGKKTGRGHSWTKSRVCSLRNYHKIVVFDPKKKDHLYCDMKEAASILDISPMSVRRLIQNKVLPAQQTVPTAPWRIERKELQSRRVILAVQAIKAGRKVPLPQNPDQLTLIKSET
jgi:DNA invertase Pin-like site-specific DNA recombinase